MPPTRALLCALALALCAAPARADDPDWQPVLAELLKSEKTGFGGLCGVAVERESGDVYVDLSDLGLYRSASGAKKFERVTEKQPKGRTETPGCMLFDPTGKSKRLVTALVYGAPISVSDDLGKTWSHMGKDSGHVDWCAVDWADMKFVLTLKHEKGGLLLSSADGGKTFSEVGTGYATGWVFDGKTAVVAEAKSKAKPKPNLMRTTDGGKTWKAAGQYSPVGSQSAQALPRWHDGKLYWLVDGALIVTADKGETWKKVSDIKDARYGPVFGKDGKHLFVLTNAGVIESADGGEKWSKPIALPKGLKGAGGLTWLEYDPKGKFLYVMKMTSDLYRLAH